MSTYQKQQLYLHKHYHYNYYDQGLKHATNMIKHKAMSPVIGTPQKTQQNNSGILPTKSNWKSKLNPEVAQIYEQINGKIYGFSSGQLKYSSNVRIKSPDIRPFVQKQNINTKNNHNLSKQDLLKQIKRYEQYLKKVSRPNLYIPKGVSVKKLLSKKEQIHNDEQQQQQKYKRYPQSTSTLVSLNQQLLDIDQNQQKINIKKNSNINIDYLKHKYDNNDDLTTTRADSKLLSTITINQTIENDNGINNNNNTISEFVQSREQGMNKYLQQQKYKSKQCVLKNDWLLDNQYGYNLLREQCEYLRDKFIQHFIKEKKQKDQAIKF